jgi:hypothetical protein
MAGNVRGEILGDLFMMAVHVLFHMPLIAHLRPPPLLLAARDVVGEVGLRVELREALVSGVLQTDGVVEVIAPDDRLAAYEGVGALLRYK